ncbi:MAG: MFS transporter [Akkermansiaceae bacterium]
MQTQSTAESPASAVEPPPTGRPGGKLPTKTKAVWASGAFADVFMANSFNYLALPIYNLALKVDPVFLGWAMGIPRIWEALSDALVGNISDNTRSRWGRRRPYVAVGAVLSGLTFALVWMPPAHSTPQVIGLFFLITSILYYTAYAIFTVPWIASGLELSTDYHERTNVQAWKNVFQAVGGLFLGALWWLSLRLGSDEVEGVRWVGIIFGVLIAVFGLIPAIFGKERPSAGQRQRKIPLLAATSVTFRNPAFLCLAGFTLCILFGIFVINPLALYINVLYVFGGDKTQVSTLNLVVNAAFQAAGLAITPLVAAIAARVGKRRTLVGGTIMVMIGFFSSWWTYTPSAPYLQMVSLILLSPGLACLWIIGPSMLADVCDLDESRTGLRREGVYSACYAWTIKAGIALTMVFGGYMLNWAGFDAKLEANQAEGVIDRIRLLYMLVPIGMCLLALVFIHFYPLTERRVAELRRQLPGGTDQG